ncbi:UvrD-helicase domain-containing protein [Nocardia rhamnosiphila]|uniref:UvrD-helicase domain-containing protein n=1 Tax=Nocardia rhamnosiphila TaxID=426716 RepID=UPI0033DB9D08
MAVLRIGKEFLLDYGKLDRPLQVKISEVFGKFADSTHTGIHLEKINAPRHPRYRSIRIDGFWRGIVLAPESGSTYLLLRVLPHDDAYAWAQRHELTVNRATGGIEIGDTAALDELMPALDSATQHTTARLFEQIKDKDLLRLGVDERTLRFARTLTSAEPLEAAQDFLPTTQWQVLYGLAAGLSPDEVWAELGTQLTSETIDVDDIDAAIDRSHDRIVVVDGPEELKAVFDNPFALWRIFLHPTQQSVVDAIYNGPARVSGGPGTGKTVVALHRARRLAEAGTGPVLVTTFTSTLNDSLQDGIGMLVDDPAVAARISVCHIDRLANRIFREVHGTPAFVTNEDELWRAAAVARPHPFTETFLAEEWRQVVLAQQVGDEDGYLLADRRGRGRRLGIRQKLQIWSVISAFEQILRDRKLWTYETVRREATRILEGRADKPYCHVVIDEAQDLGLDQWRLVRAAVAPGVNDIFIAGDPHQRIYNHHVTLRNVDINVTGRSHRLSINYRTTAEILHWSLGIMLGEPVDDMAGGAESLAGCRSEVHGRPPEPAGFDSAASEIDHVVAKVRDWLTSGIDPADIGIATRAKYFGRQILQALRIAGIPTHLLEEGRAATDAVSIGTMHRMKGLEFRCLAVAGAGAGAIPAPGAVTPAGDDLHTHERDIRRERSLLFVACTRAREQLVVTWHGPVSPFLAAQTQPLGKQAQVPQC